MVVVFVTKLQKATISFVCPSVRLHENKSLPPTGQNFTKFRIRVSLENMSRKSKYRVFNLKVDRILNMSNLFTKVYNMLYYTTNLYLQ